MIVGIAQVKANLRKEMAKIKRVTLSGVILAGEHVRKKAVTKAPIATGNLRNSSFITYGSGTKTERPPFKGKDAANLASSHSAIIAESKGRTSSKITPKVEVGFSAVYAMSVHENPRAGITNGKSPEGKEYKPPKGSTQIAYAEQGGWKFLEQAFGESIGKMLSIIKKKARV